jgi:hypothetical protein
MRRVEPSAALFMAPRMAMMMGLRGGRGQAVGGLVQPVDDVCVFVFFHGAPEKTKKNKKQKKKKKKKNTTTQPPAPCKHPDIHIRRLANGGMQKK